MSTLAPSPAHAQQPPQVEPAIQETTPVEGSTLQYVVRPNTSLEAVQCTFWLIFQPRAGLTVIVPELSARLPREQSGAEVPRTRSW